jgi:hypothetical protein
VQLRIALRLRARPRSLESTTQHAHARLTQDKVVDAVRFSETINGRPYVIEVSPVGRDRWRAQLARTPNGTTALMPFYGQTPDEAARRLAIWLARAVRVATST